MLTPKDLDPDAMAPGVFMDVQTSTGAVLLTATPLNVLGDSCGHCVFGAHDDYKAVRCAGVLWGTKETFIEYLQHKTLK